jgi:endo-1,4-beta-xylanase
MLTNTWTRRRTLATLGPAALALRGLLHAQQQAAHPADEMGLNTQQHQQHFPPPDFGPLPATLPPEALALRGKASLKHHAEAHGRLAGAAVVVKALDSDPALQQLIADQYAILVPEGELKWVALRPARERFDFSQADALMRFAQTRGMQVRGHTLCWHNSVPDWLTQDAGQLDVRQLLIEHIQTVMGRYRGRIQSWDVVNEAILPADKLPGGMRNSFWFQHAGPDYIDLAFRTARAADPHAKLTYNDYGVEYDNADNAERRRLILDLLRGMKDRGVPLDAVGIQAHIKAAQTDRIGAGLADYIAAIRAMRLEVYLTELDVNEDDITSNDPAERDRQVAKTYRQFLSTCLPDPAVKMVLTWGVSDRRTWLNDGPTHHRKQPDRPQRSLPFDPQYRPTPAFFALRDTLDLIPGPR